MIIIDAKNLIIGRLSTKIAKGLLQGESYIIINSEKAVVTGNKIQILEKYKQDYDKGVPLKGPYFPKKPNDILKRTIRGMVPYKTERGINAMKNLKCYIGFPKEFEGKDLLTFDDINVDNKRVKSVSLLEISKKLGYNEVNL